MKAAIHPLQAARIAELRAYDILDTPRESDFDDVVSLAAAICGTPISVVNLIDEDRQWFKAEVGLGVRETPLDTSICAHVILEQDFVEIGDTLADSRMADNPLCAGEQGLRFYAGALLQTENGLPLGTLCVLDYQARELNDFQRGALRVLARQVMKQLELRRALINQATLMDEIDHRVKNSLQAVASLVTLQRGNSKDEVVRAALDEVSGRLRTVSLVHEELNAANAVQEIDMGAYLRRLGDLLRSNAPSNAAIIVNADSIIADARVTTSVGMIVSEFVTNSLKHAFPNGREGQVRITLRREGDGALQLLCEDDGVGVRAVDVASGKPRGLGLRIIAASVSQLAGKMDVAAAGEGYRLLVTFKIGEPA